MTVAILKYNAGNVFSVKCALDRLAVDSVVSSDPDVLEKASHVIIPGVGEASSAMSFLNEKGLSELIPALKQPVLGICLGLQIFCSKSEENQTDCLGLFEQDVVRFTKPKKVPHIGWNAIYDLKGPLFKGIKSGSQVYFVHSYFAELGSDTVARCDYFEEFSAAVASDNFMSVQFHAEKSGQVGSLLLKNFVEL